MSKVLRASNAVGYSFLNVPFGSPPAEVWVTCRAGFFADALPFWIDNHSPVFIKFGAFAGVTDAGLLIIGDGPDPIWTLQTGAGSTFIGSPPEGDAMHLYEFRYVNDGTTEFYYDGVLAATHTSSSAESPASLTIGLFSGSSPNPDPTSIIYFDDVKAGTTRGASDLFSDDFESGDLSAWTHTTGDVSVVDDPFPVDAFTLPVFFVAFDDPTLEADPTWTQVG